MTDPDAVEAAVRRYLARLARRWSPLAVVGVVLLLVLTLVSPADNGKNSDVASGNGAGRTTRSTAAGAKAGGAQADAAAADAGAAPASASGVSAGGAGNTDGGGPEAPAPQVGAAGVARSGVACGPTVRQVPWSVYAPICQPKFTGDNRGATSHGVTATTITGAFRRTNSAEEKAAFAALGDAAPGTDDEYLSDLRAYFDLFNNSFELYGRKLVVKDFNGQGDNLEEDQGRNLQGAQADAATARNIGAFMDLSSSPTLASTQPYEENLAHEKVVAIGAVGLPQQWFKKYAPYEWSITPTGTQAIDAVIHAFCQRAFGLPAADAGDPTYRSRTRTFGVVLPENPEYKQLGDELEAGVLKECGAKFAKRIEYSINVATEEQQSVSIVAQMHAANITTVACICDPVVEVFLSHAADQQKYGPEWSPVPWLDPQGRTVNQAQWAHAVAGQWLYFPPPAQSEAYRAFKLARPNAEPAEKYYVEAYWTAAYVFTVLQNAGPNLTPQTFAQGAFGMTKSGRGMFGTWEGGPDKFSPTTEAQVGYWDQNAISNMDGKKGAWVPCEGGKWFSLSDPSTWAPARTQIKCR